MIPLKTNTDLYRPSHKELNRKLKELRTLIDNDQWRPADVAKLKANFDEIEDQFGIFTTTANDQKTILQAVAQEITPEHYAGTRPPQEAYEEAIKGEDLFAFRWDSAFFRNHKMYFKFAVKGADKGRRAYICSIHEDR